MLVLLVLALDLVTSSAAPHGTVVRLRLLAPSGPLPVGTTVLHLVDHGRVDPWLPSSGARELMVSLWYPTRPSGRRPPASWMPRLAADHYLACVSGRGMPPAELSRVPNTHTERDSPVSHRPGGWPVVLFSPGYGEDRALGTELTEDLRQPGNRGRRHRPHLRCHRGGVPRPPARAAPPGSPNSDDVGDIHAGQGRGCAVRARRADRAQPSGQPGCRAPRVAARHHGSAGPGPSGDARTLTGRRNDCR
ncbi:MAG: hypothetical protein QOG46_187, partial [Pseudonocardiales bacterium]|nr:hypothetical protein [Pseudonocardiales bacterium]